MNSPFTENELKALQKKVSDFSLLCFKSGSMDRGVKWACWVSVLQDVMLEEAVYDYKFPSTRKERSNT